jgi:hypothetical protein
MQTLLELERRCQKPDYRRVGNWMARRITRPLALRVTRVVLPLGVSAHAATLAAWAVAMSAVAGFAWGGVSGWLLGAALLQLWYLLDHVDGQLARYHGTESLDGAALDYLMHHAVNLLVPLGIGWGMAASQRWWLVPGLAWGVGLLLLGLASDVRYKAFIKRLKRLDGELRVIGGGGGRPGPPAPLPWRPTAAAAWLARKACETHVTMNVLGGIALMQWALTLWLPQDALRIGCVYMSAMGALAPLAAAAAIWRSLSQQAAEREFAAWYRPAEGCPVVFEDGWWRVEALSGSNEAIRRELSGAEGHDDQDQQAVADVEEEECSQRQIAPPIGHDP